MLLNPALFRPRSLMARLVKFLTGATGLLIAITIGTLLVRMVSSVTLAHLLDPSAFGLMGIINSIFFTIVMLTDLGFQAHVVRHPDGDDPYFGDVIWTIHMTRGLAICLFSVLAAPVLAMLLHKPELAWPLAVASLTLGINGLTSLALFTTLRRGGVRRLSIFEFALVVFQTAASILLAMWLRSAWALVYAMLAQSVLRTVLSYFVFHNPRRRLARDRAISSEFFAFSRVVMMSSTTTLILSQADRFVLARAFTLAEFGLYAIAINLATAPASFVNSFVTRVTYPIFARTWNRTPERLPQVFYTAGRKTAWLYAAGCGALVGAAPLIVHILYDPRYAQAGTFLSLLAVSAVLKLPTFSTSMMMTAIGKVRTTLYVNIVRIIWLATVGTLAFLKFHAIGLIATVGLIEVPALLYSWYVLRREGILNLREEFTYLTIAAASASALGSCTYLLLPR
ncbi:MAG TPA: oligosaccharide flippase family protein [Sphingomonas sp.]|nr:oligosaccharide flippase family protein [Sphingomonas sp.]